MGSGPKPPPVTGSPAPDLSGAFGGALSGTQGLTSGNFADITNLSGNVPGTVSPITSMFPTSFNAGVSGAQNAAPYLSGAGFNAIGTGQNLNNAGNQLLPYATSIENMGLDPQSALYARTQAAADQQNAAILGGSGVVNTPFGDSSRMTANNNFNIDWQNQQLQRAISAGQSAGGLINQAGQTGAQAFGLGTGGAGSLVNASTLPFTTGMGLTGSELGMLNNAGVAGNTFSQLPQMSIGDYLNYIQGGNQTNQVYNQGQIGSYNAQTQAATAQNNMFSQLGGGAISALNMFGSTGPFGPAGAFSGVGSGLASLGSGFGSMLSGAGGWLGSLLPMAAVAA